MLMTTKKFTSKADVTVVDRLYSEFFEGVTQFAEHLDFSSLQWGDDEAGKLAHVLPRFSRLTMLDLANNRVGAQGATALGQYLKTQTDAAVLSNLSVAGNTSISGEAAQQLATAALSSKSLQVLSDVPIKELREDKHTSLDLRGKRLGPTEAIALAELVK